MKTVIDLFKPTIRLLILLSALFINSGISAQKSFNNIEAKKFSDMLIRSSADIIADLTTSFRTDVYFEEQIALEDWMVDLTKFAKKYENTSNSESILDSEFNEPKMEMDDWMMESDWNYINNDKFKEDVLKLEKWMCCPRNWAI